MPPGVPRVRPGTAVCVVYGAIAVALQHPLTKLLTAGTYRISGLPPTPIAAQSGSAAMQNGNDMVPAGQPAGSSVASEIVTTIAGTSSFTAMVPPVLLLLALSLLVQPLLALPL